MAKIDLKTVGTFVGGVLFGTAGLKILGSDDAKKVYTNCTAAGMRAKDCVMKTVSTVQENVGDIVAEAEQINEERSRKLKKQLKSKMLQKKPRLMHNEVSDQA